MLPVWWWSILKPDLPLKKTNFPFSLSKAALTWVGSPLQKWPNGHGISIQNMVVAYPPEPFVLKEKRDLFNSLLNKPSCQKSNKVVWVYLEHKHFSSEGGDGVEVSVADVGAKARLVWWIRGIGVVVRRIGRNMGGLRAWSRPYVNKDIWKLLS